MVGMHHLPEDILFEILVKTPTKPLMRFRCLSKHWNLLISDHFMKSRSRRRLLLPFQPLQAIDYPAPGDHSVCSVSKLPSSLTNPGSKDHVITAGTVNGIVLLVLKDMTMILYNPFTQAFKVVPNKSLDTSYHSADAYGFCYGTTPDDLKIVRIRHGGSFGFCEASRWCDVFSLKKGLWSTNFGTLVGRWIIKQRAATFLNGFLYWIAVEGTMRSLIVVLDVKGMVFSKIQLPFSSCLNCLGTSGGRLHVFGDTDTKFELWVVNENVIEKSWYRVSVSNGLVPRIHPR